MTVEAAEVILPHNVFHATVTRVTDAEGDRKAYAPTVFDLQAEGGFPHDLAALIDDEGMVHSR